ncbi:MAG: HAD family hydrolase [Campylobacter sputorum]|uniref:HAD family hydrolase n=2 Tax=Campylobacter sputorum TaxID=206 RepID=UPI000B790EF7|nr:HAD family hydrolase [Campylobacter sputorum]ASM38349.1 putative phosphoglycolate phosphatase [Campylobacter sputorum bv. paraureolyticus LMG 11764]MDY6119737.1 HAD family hydrolase [Campylobacter sputorum]
MSMNTKTIIFDMDGTIIDSSEAICVTINQTRRNIGLKTDLQKEFILKTINSLDKNMTKEFFNLENPTNKMMQDFQKDFDKNYNIYAKKYECVDEILDFCISKKYFVVLASNAPQDSLKAILEKNKIYDKFNFIIGFSKNTPKKPDPTMLNLAKEKGLNNTAVFIGDSIKDEMAAINANMAYINVSWGFGENSNKFKNAKNSNELIKFIEDI